MFRSLPFERYPRSAHMSAHECLQLRPYFRKDTFESKGNSSEAGHERDCRNIWHFTTPSCRMSCQRRVHQIASSVLSPVSPRHKGFSGTIETRARLLVDNTRMIARVYDGTSELSFRSRPLVCCSSWYTPPSRRSRPLRSASTKTGGRGEVHCLLLGV